MLIRLKNCVAKTF